MFRKLTRPHQHLFRSRLLLAVAGIAVFFGPGASVAAQAPGAGSLAGRVTNVQTGAYLEGAEIRLVELNRQTTSNREGLYALQGVPAGQYTLQVSYLGIETLRQAVEVRAGEQSFQELALRSLLFRLEEMVITSQIEGQAHAINLQRSASSLRTIVSQDALG